MNISLISQFPCVFSGQSEASGYPESDEPPKAGGGDKFEDVNAENQDSSAAQQPQDAALDQDSSGATPAGDQSYTDKAARGAQGLRDAAYGTAGAAAGAVGYHKLTESGKTDHDTNTPQDDTPGVQEKAQDLGQQASHGASDAANTVGDKANEGATQAQESLPDVPASATGKDLVMAAPSIITRYYNCILLSCIRMCF